MTPAKVSHSPDAPFGSTEKRGAPPNCPHCGHPLADHHMLHPVYDRMAEFHCSECVCYINGSAERR